MKQKDFVVAPAPDRDSKPWWEALGRHELLIQRCDGCGRLRWPARVMCAACGAFTWSWVPAAGTGTVTAWNVTWRAADPRVAVPYVVVLVRLDDQEDIVIPGGYDGPTDGAGLHVGLSVQAGFADLPRNGEESPVALLSWRPVTDQGEA